MKRLVMALPALLLVTSAAHAQSAAAASQQLFQDGAALLKAGKVHDACLKFAESEKLDPQLGTLLNLAACHEQEGKVASAWGEYTELAGVAGKKGDKKRAAYATKKLAELDKQLPHLQLEVPAGTTELAVDGVALGQAAWGSSLPTDPGQHEIAYWAPGKKRGVETVSLAKGESKVAKLPALLEEPIVKFTHEPEPEPTRPVVASGPAPAATAPPAKQGGTPLRTAGFVVGGLGVVGLGLGAAFGVMALGSKGDVDTGCAGNQCSQAGLDAASNARTQATISTIGIAAGGVCLAAGVTMVLLGGKRSEAHLALTPTPGGITALGSF